MKTGPHDKYASGEGILPISFLEQQKTQTVERESAEKEVILKTKPDIVTGINHVKKARELPIFQAFLSSELQGSNAKAVWIDTGNEASTYSLSALGNPQLLEQVEIGRAFTVFQHHNLIHQLDEFIGENTDILVLPNFDELYLDGQVKEWEAEELFKESWKKIREIQEEKELKVLISSSGNSKMSHILEADSDNKIEVDSTSSGLKYSSENYQQMMYKEQGSLQTTLPYWSRKNREDVKVTARTV
ncbi:hypothetical protein ACK3SF_04020 [Candidatus Nanosalina sp. VS9-1]|uniref:hypothetical protein n=1 Tax=Candidatus Nanosalina sp. VS9-1 TaxID=3388566 RepID=UPI0039E19B11